MVLSVISEIELLAFPDITIENEQQIREFLDHCIIIDFKKEIKELIIEFRRKYKLKLPDAIVASAEHYNKIPLLTGDKAFRKIEELDIIIFEG